MNKIQELLIFAICSLVVGIAIGYGAKVFDVWNINRRRNVPVEINVRYSNRPASPQRLPSYEFSEEVAGSRSAEAPPLYRSQERIETVSLDLRPSK